MVSGMARSMLFLVTFLVSLVCADNFGFIYPNATLPADKNLVLTLGQNIDIKWHSPFAAVKLAFIALGGGKFIFIDQNESGSEFSWAVNVNNSGSSQPYYYLYFENQADNQQHYYSALFRVDSPVDAAHTESSIAFPTSTSTPSNPTTASVLVSTVTVGPTAATTPNAAAASSASAAAALQASEESSGLSSGAKAGIGIGVTITVLAALGAAAFFLLRRRKRRQQRASQQSDLPLGYPPSFSPNQPPQEMSTYAPNDAYGHYGAKQGMQEAPATDESPHKRGLGRDGSGAYELAAATDYPGTAELPGSRSQELEAIPNRLRGGGGGGSRTSRLGPPARKINWQAPTSAAPTESGVEVLSPRTASMRSRAAIDGEEGGGGGEEGEGRGRGRGEDVGRGEEGGVSPGGFTDTRTSSNPSRTHSWMVGYTQ